MKPSAEDYEKAIKEADDDYTRTGNCAHWYPGRYLQRAAELAAARVAGEQEAQGEVTTKWLHDCRIEACGAWSAVVDTQTGNVDEAKTAIAQRAEGKLRTAIDMVCGALTAEREKFQQETLRTSELAVLIREWLQIYEPGHSHGEGFMNCIRCTLVARSQALLAKPINAAPQAHGPVVKVSELRELAATWSYKTPTIYWGAKNECAEELKALCDRATKEGTT